MLGQRVAVEHRRAGDQDAVKMQEDTLSSALRREAEMTAVNPNVLPRRRVPLLPGKRGHAMGQRDAGKAGVLKRRRESGRVELAAKKPIAIQRPELAGCAGGIAGREPAGPKGRAGGQSRASQRARPEELPPGNSRRLLKQFKHNSALSSDVAAADCPGPAGSILSAATRRLVIYGRVGRLASFLLPEVSCKSNEKSGENMEWRAYACQLTQMGDWMLVLDGPISLISSQAGSRL